MGIMAKDPDDLHHPRGRANDAHVRFLPLEHLVPWIQGCSREEHILYY